MLAGPRTWSGTCPRLDTICGISRTFSPQALLPSLEPLLVFFLSSVAFKLKSPGQPGSGLPGSSTISSTLFPFQPSAIWLLGRIIFPLVHQVLPCLSLGIDLNLCPFPSLPSSGNSFPSTFSPQGAFLDPDEKYIWHMPLNIPAPAMFWTLSPPPTLPSLFASVTHVCLPLFTTCS